MINEYALGPRTFVRRICTRCLEPFSHMTNSEICFRCNGTIRTLCRPMRAPEFYELSNDEKLDLRTISGKKRRVA